MGSSWSAYEFTSWNSQYKIEDLFWEQRVGPEFSFRVGNQAPQATINTFRFKDARASFTASPLAFSETIPYPAFRAGLSFRWRSDDNGFYIHGVLNDMNGNPSQGSLNWSHIKSSELFSGLEVGKQWRRENGEYDQLSLLIFHAGTRSIFSPETTPNEAGSGFKLLAEKQWGSIVSFASYTYNEARGGSISTTFSNNIATGGLAFLNPFGINGEVAVAGMWSRPFNNIFPGSGQREQTGIETYWNLALAPNITVTPGFKFISNPPFNPKTDFVVVPEIKVRMSL
ncbi:carbohydrate porin [Serratia sp. L9]|uniref:carbohydrate porin n=1 Tax=Serratia sp. L9 TaxID=3423946 RepID=UPI003D66C6CB